MSFDEKEYSTYGGAPVELFLFQDDRNINQWAFTTGDESIQVGSVIYEPGTVKRSAIKHSADDSPAPITIDLPADNTLALQFRSYLPSRPIGLRVFRYHRTDAAMEQRVVFIGSVTSAKFKPDGMASLSCYPITKSSLRRVPWQVYKSGCNWALYGAGCAVLKSAFELDRPALIGIANDTIQSAVFSSFEDAWFTNGYVEVIATGETRFITEHVGNTIRLIYPFESLSTDDEVKVYPGCDRTSTTCRDKFDNLDNYLGFDYIPSKSPFEDPMDETRANGSGSPARSWIRPFGDGEP